MLLLCHHRDELIFGLKYEGGGQSEHVVSPDVSRGDDAVKEEHTQPEGTCVSPAAEP